MIEMTPFVSSPYSLMMTPWASSPSSPAISVLPLMRSCISRLHSRPGAGDTMTDAGGADPLGTVSPESSPAALGTRSLYQRVGKGPVDRGSAGVSRLSHLRLPVPEKPGITRRPGWCEADGIPRAGTPLLLQLFWFQDALPVYASFVLDRRRLRSRSIAVKSSAGRISRG